MIEVAKTPQASDDDQAPKDAEDSASTPADEAKRKFREALDRKHAHGGRDVSAGGSDSKVHGSHRAETSGAQQMFRRKSGG
ncbi:hypothetical protein AZH51_04470 [Branchiibius sp. NY16-3462-2]|nr:hypothetical protein AZH51_04470 [Branchiibius sp. NY16-3462-2]